MTKPQFDERVNPVTYKDTNLFKPIKLGDIEISHRAVLAPLTRLRADPDTYVANVELASEYYSQRSKTPGSLVITEGIVVSEATTGFFDGCPGIWSEAQVEAWSKIFKSIKDNGSFVVAQLFGLGRQAIPDVLAKKGIAYKAPSTGIYIEDGFYPFKEKSLELNTPLTAMTLEEVEQHVKDFVQAGVNSINAGADGVQIHVANGYLLNQFIDPEANHRTDKYGGSIENRARLPLEILDKLIEKIGAQKISVRLSPYSKFGGLKGNEDPTLLAQYAYIIGELEKRAQQGNRLQFLDIVEPRVNGANDVIKKNDESNQFIYTIWKGPIVRAGNYINNPDQIKKDISDDRTLISFGRYFISNPDLLERLKNGYPLNKYNRDTFYSNGPLGYTDYPTYTAE